MATNTLLNPRSILLLALLPLVACSNPEAQKRRHFERGNQYAAEKRDEFAVIEYANAVRLDPKFGEARLKLAETYERMNNLRAAFPEFVRAADALPDNRDVQIKATRVAAPGRPLRGCEGACDDAARPRTRRMSTRCSCAPTRWPGSKIQQARSREIEEALKIRAEREPRLRRPRRAFACRAATRRKLKPRSGRRSRCSLRRSRRIWRSPTSCGPPAANRGGAGASSRRSRCSPNTCSPIACSAALYMATKRPAEAEQPLKVVAEISQSPAARFQLADYYRQCRPRRGSDQTVDGFGGRPGRVRRRRGGAGVDGL